MVSPSARRLSKLVLLCLALPAFASLAAADEAANLGRSVIGKWEKAVITVRITSKTRMVAEGKEMGKQEGTNEATATVIDPSGLAVLSLAEADPAQVFASMMGRGEEKLKVESEVTEVKMRLADGKELRAKIVLRDKDLDLAFVRPTEKLAEPLFAVDLKEEAKPEVLDQVILVSRLGEVANRAPAASLARIKAIITKPRTFYVPSSQAGEEGLGCPVFSLEGKAIGLLLLRTLGAAGGGVGGIFGGMGEMGMLPVILPAGDIVEAAKQVGK